MYFTNPQPECHTIFYFSFLGGLSYLLTQIQNNCDFQKAGSQVSGTLPTALKGLHTLAGKEPRSRCREFIYTIWNFLTNEQPAGWPWGLIPGLSASVRQQKLPTHQIAGKDVNNNKRGEDRPLPCPFQFFKQTILIFFRHTKC